jgi:hypothetical protein
MIRIADCGLRIVRRTLWADCPQAPAGVRRSPAKADLRIGDCGLGIDRQDDPVKREKLPFKFPLNAEGIDVHY